MMNVDYLSYYDYVCPNACNWPCMHVSKASFEGQDRYQVLALSM
jgi:hypothetical protein